MTLFYRDINYFEQLHGATSTIIAVGYVPEQSNKNGLSCKTIDLKVGSTIAPSFVVIVRTARTELCVALYPPETNPSVNLTTHNC